MSTTQDPRPTATSIAATAWINGSADMTRTYTHDGETILTLGDRALVIGEDYEDKPADDDSQIVWGWTWTTYVRDEGQDCGPMVGWEETGTDSTQSVDAALAAIAAWFAKVEMTASPYRILSVEDM